MGDSASNMTLSTPADIRLGLTRQEDVGFPLRWGIMGAGRISRQWVLVLKACKGATVTAIAARDENRAIEFARKYGIPSAYGSYAEMVASPDVDIIYIGTITPLHKEHTLLALNAGKHVLCEKPLAENLSDAQQMYANAEERNLMLQDALWTRFFPAVEHARGAIEAGVIGEVTVMTSSFFDPFYAVQYAPLAFGTTSQPSGVTVVGWGGIIEYGAGKTAVLAYPPPSCELLEVTDFVGTKGRITLEQPGHCPTVITIRVPPQVPSLYRTGNLPAPIQRFEYPLPGSVAISHAYPGQHGFLYQAEAVHRCLANGLRVCPQYNMEESLHTMGIWTQFLASRKAWKSHRA